MYAPQHHHPSHLVAAGKVTSVNRNVNQSTLPWDSTPYENNMKSHHAESYPNHPLPMSNPTPTLPSASSPSHFLSSPYDTIPPSVSSYHSDFNKEKKMSTREIVKPLGDSKGILYHEDGGEEDRENRLMSNYQRNYIPHEGGNGNEIHQNANNKTQNYKKLLSSSTSSPLFHDHNSDDTPLPPQSLSRESYPNHMKNRDFTPSVRVKPLSGSISLVHEEGGEWKENQNNNISQDKMTSLYRHTFTRQNPHHHIHPAPIKPYQSTFKIHDYTTESSSSSSSSLPPISLSHASFIHHVGHNSNDPEYLTMLKEKEERKERTFTSNISNIFDMVDTSNSTLRSQSSSHDVYRKYNQKELDGLKVNRKEAEEKRYENQRGGGGARRTNREDHNGNNNNNNNNNNDSDPNHYRSVSSLSYISHPRSHVLPPTAINRKLWEGKPTQQEGGSNDISTEDRYRSTYKTQYKGEGKGRVVNGEDDRVELAKTLNESSIPLQLSTSLLNKNTNDDHSDDNPDRLRSVYGDMNSMVRDPKVRKDALRESFRQNLNGHSVHIYQDSSSSSGDGLNEKTEPWQSTSHLAHGLLGGKKPFRVPGPKDKMKAEDEDREFVTESRYHYQQKFV